MWKKSDVQTKWTLSEAVDIPFMKLNRMNTQERAELASFFQREIEKRVQTYTRAKNYSNPYAFVKLTNEWRELGEATGESFDFYSPIIKEWKEKGRIYHDLGDDYASLNRPAAKLLSYITQAQNFFASKSSTVAGWKDIIRAESAKLFGTTTYMRNGKEITRLNYLMTEEERAKFWALYDELRKSGKVAIYDSESMRVTGFLRIWREGIKNKSWDFNDLTGMMNETLTKMRDRGVPVRDLPEHENNGEWDPTRPTVEHPEDLSADEWAAHTELEFQW